MKYLTYIDILGFGALVEADPDGVWHLYNVIDGLNAHRHEAFNTIVFSDTVLIYSDAVRRTIDDDFYDVWYSCEFVQDLFYRLIGEGLYFRAVLTYGTFAHKRLRNLDAFFGTALLAAFRTEKNIPSTGLYIDGHCARHNRYFRTTPFDEAWHFVDLTHSLNRLRMYDIGSTSLPGSLLTESDEFDTLPLDMLYMKDVRRMSREHPDPRIRAKHLMTMDLYSQIYPDLLDEWSSIDFDAKLVSDDPKWHAQVDRMLARHNVTSPQANGDSEKTVRDA